MEKIWNQLKDGLQRYALDNGFSDVILGLSGGMDSALVSVLATDALGAEHVHCLMMKTVYTSELSLQIAQELADLNGFDYQVINIDPVVEAQKNFLTAVMKTDPKPIVFENLQARERGKTLMAFSNQFGYLVLACGNKSEAAMGYCTLYGDVCGGLLPIGDIYKTQIFELGRWRNKKGYVIPEAVIKRAPSAELNVEQKDEDTLPPYAVLDQILNLFLEGKKNAAEIKDRGFAPEVVDWVLRQYRKSAFKRKQMPEVLTLG